MGTRQEVGIFILVLILSLLELMENTTNAYSLSVIDSSQAHDSAVCPIDDPSMSAARCVLLGLPIPINLATAEHLQVIPGIGSVLAQRIVDGRNRRGGFDFIEELTEISGIGPKRLATMRLYVGMGATVP